MDRFGVRKPALRAIARTPVLPGAGPEAPSPRASKRSDAQVAWLGATVKNLVGLGEISATGMHAEIGVRITAVPPENAAAKAGFMPNDAILKCNGRPTDTVEALLVACRKAAGQGRSGLEVWRKQKNHTVEWEFQASGKHHE